MSNTEIEKIASATPEITTAYTERNRGRSNLTGAQTDEQILQAWLRDTTSGHTAQMYERIGRMLIKFLPHGIVGAETMHLDRFEDMLLGKVMRPYMFDNKTMSPSTVATYMAVVRSLFAFAERADYIHKSPAHVRKVRTPERTRTNKVLSEDEVMAIITNAGIPRNKTLLECLFTTGMRVKESMLLRWSHVKFEGQNAFVAVLGKGNRVRHLKFAPGLTKRLLQLRGLDYKESDPVFTSGRRDKDGNIKPLATETVRDVLHNACWRAGITKPVSPHWFRHTYATLADRKGKPTTAIRDTLGHTNLNTTMGYVAPYNGVLLSEDFITERELDQD